MRKLERSNTDKWLMGVCGGLAVYFHQDPTLVRAGFAFVTIVTGLLPGVVGYLVLSLIIPPKGGKSFIEGEVIDKNSCNT